MLSISVNGQRKVECKTVVLFDNGVPIAAATENSGSIIWADAIREPRDLAGILKDTGEVSKPEHKLVGSVHTDPRSNRPIFTEER